MSLSDKREKIIKEIVWNEDHIKRYMDDFYKGNDYKDNCASIDAAQHLKKENIKLKAKLEVYEDVEESFKKIDEELSGYNHAIADEARELIREEAGPKLVEKT